MLTSLLPQTSHVDVKEVLGRGWGCWGEGHHSVKHSFSSRALILGVRGGAEGHVSHISGLVRVAG